MSNKLSAESSSALDLVRGLAAQMVVFGHGMSFFNVFNSFRPPHLPSMQSAAVLIFFLLSGFLISYSISHKKKYPEYSFVHYFIDRFSRIYTVFIPAIFFVLIVDYINISMSPDNYHYYEAFNLATFLGNLVMIQDIKLVSDITTFGSSRPFWTLAAEWWIYIFVGYMVFKGKNEKQNLLNYIFFIIILGLVPAYFFLGGRGSGMTLYWSFGAFMFITWNSNILSYLDKQKKIFLLLIVFILTSMRVLTTVKVYDSIFCFGVLLFLLLFIDVVKGISMPKYVYRFCKFLASYSYTLYLTHYCIFRLVANNYLESVNPYILLFVTFILSNFVAFFLGSFFEIKLTPIIKKKLYVFQQKIH